MLLVAFILGLASGIIINSLADSLPPDEVGQRHPLAPPRCWYCRARHVPRYWLAVAAFALRRGRCEHCGAPRPLRHTVVELGAGIGLALAWGWSAAGNSGVEAQGARFGAAAVILVLYILITVIDVEHRLILRSVVLPGIVVVGLIGLARPGYGPAKTLAGGVAGYGIVLAMFLLAQVFSLLVARWRGQPLDDVVFGGGDVNLGGLVGLTVGWPGVLLSLLIAIFAGGLFSAAYIAVQVLRRRYDPYAAIPYGPFLVLGALAIYFFGREFAEWYASR